MAAVHFDGGVSILDIRSKAYLRSLKVHDELAHTFTQLNAFKIATSSPDGTLAVSDWQIGEVRWKQKVGEAERKVDGRWVGTGVFAQAAWEVDGRWRLVAGTKDGRVLVFDVENG